MAFKKEGQYLLTPSTINVTNFVPTKLWFSEIKSNYEIWKEQMLCLLQSQELEHLVVGQTQTNNQQGVHLRTDQLVRGWILGSINDDIITSDLLKLKTSKEVWLALRKKFYMLSNTVVTPSELGENVEQKDFDSYLPLYKAILEEEWEAFKNAIKADDHQGDYHKLRARNDIIMTALHVAIGRGKGMDTIEKLVELINDHELEDLLDNFGTTILGMAAAVGNEQAAKDIVGKVPDLIDIPNNFGIQQLGEKELRPQFSMSSSDRDIEIMADDDQPRGVFQKLHAILGRYMERLVPQIREFKEKLLVNQTAVELVKSLCKQMESLKYPTAAAIYFDAIMIAVESEIHEVIDVIAKSYPAAVYRSTPSSQFVFQIAVQKRSTYVFKLISEYQTVQKHLYSDVRDSDGNNLLHLAGKLSPSEKLNEISGAALQMQHELQWYKAVESFVHPYCKDQTNNAGKTPKMVFAEEHQQLKKDGQKWMKETALSYTVAAALIATLMFAAAITVPGGNEGNTGFPFFSKDPAFIIFAFSNAVSLFTSTISLLIFLSILILRYGANDFANILPRRLIAGLGFLLLSIACMMTAYTATVYLVFGQKKAWILIPAATFASMPIISFVLLQSSLISSLFLSQFGYGIFGKKRNRGSLH